MSLALEAEHALHHLGHSNLDETKAALVANKWRQDAEKQNLPA